MSTRHDGFSWWIAQQTLRHARVLMLAALALALAGAWAWRTMPRQEDPEITARAGMIIIPWPGADALTVERQVARQVEDALAKVNEIDIIQATVRDDVVIFSLTLGDHVTEATPVWREVEAQLEDVRRELPTSLGPITTRWDLLDLESVMVAVTGSADRIVLARAAKLARQRLLRVPGVARVELTADPREQITVTLDMARATSLGVSAAQLSQLLANRARLIPAGSVKVDGFKIVIDPRSELLSLAELEATPIPLPQGRSIALSQIADVRLEPEQPEVQLARVQGEPAVILGVVPRDEIDVVRWGRRVDEALAALDEELTPLQLVRVTTQPERVERRLEDLGLSLAQGVAIVALVLCLTMGLRMGVVVSMIIPLVTAAALAVFSWMGGLLQQFSIAGLVVSLGLIVDNAIVVGDRIQELLDEGSHPLDAARHAIGALMWPLAAATGTTVAAFVPLMLAKGPVGEFTRGIPWLVIVTLIISLLFALTLTPLMSVVLLRPRPRRDAEHATASSRLFMWLTALPVRSPVLMLLVAGGLMAAVAPMVPKIKREFFPLADREQLLLELELAEGVHVSHTSAQIELIERELMARPEVAQIATFVGSSTPRFYYNLPLHPQAPQLAQILVTLHDASTRWEMVEWARARGQALYPGERFVARILEQGPPTAAPIEIRLYADDASALATATREVSALVRRAPATREVRHDLPQGRPIMVIWPQDDAAGAAGVDRSVIARSLWGQTRGWPAGELSDGQDPTPIVVLAGRGERAGAALELVEVGPSLPLASVAVSAAQVRPASIMRRQGQRVVSILAQLEPGRGFNESLATIRPGLEAMSWPAGVRYEIGGAWEASTKANRAIAAGAPVGVALLLICLLSQCLSWRRTFIILLTIPLSAVGVVPGLFLWDQPFGFQSLLGVLSLAGIVVNNAILLIDVFDQERAAGRSSDDALVAAIRSRLRPIVLTSATTVLGLTPLLWSSSALWPPMASAMITGLMASTVLTLGVVPALSALVFSTRGERLRAWVMRGVVTSAVMLVATGALVSSAPERAWADEAPQALLLGLQEVMERAAHASPRSRALDAQVEATDEAQRAAWRAAWLPGVQVRGELIRRADEIALATPIGPFVQQRVWDGQAVLAVAQPLLHGERQLAGMAQARADSERVRAMRQRQRDMMSHEAATLYLGQLKLRAQLDALGLAQRSLRAQLGRVEGMLANQRGLLADRLRVQAALEELDLQVIHLEARLVGLRAQLGSVVGASGPVLARELSEAELDAPLQATSEGPRAERAALLAQLRRNEAELDALDWSLAPTVEAQGRVIHLLNTPLATATWAEVGVALVWTPFASGTRGPRQDALHAQGRALRQQLQELDAARRAQLDQLKASWDASEREVLAMARVVTRREQILTQLQAQHELGRALISEVIAAEAELASSRARHRVARLDRLERSLEFRLALGR